MKYAFMSFSFKKRTLRELLEIAIKHGYDALEPRLELEHAHGIEAGTPVKQLHEMRDMAHEMGIELCCLATTCRFADPAEASERTEMCKRIIDVASEMDVKRIRVFGGEFPDTMSRRNAQERVASHLSELSDYAGDRDVILCMETHDMWCEPEHVKYVMEMVNRKNIGVNWDIMHPVMRANRSVDYAFEHLSPWIKHVHIHDGVTGEGPIELSLMGEGVINYRRALELLLDAGYEDALSGEYYENGDPDFVGKDIVTMRRMEKELLTKGK
jgi:sugar phosphate isomerase/epimerase